MHGFFTKPNATAYIKGGADAKDILGRVDFYQKRNAVLVIAEISALPSNATGFFAFHIHEGNDCSGEGFPNTGSHYNPDQADHPNHAGDLPPLMLCNGGAKLAVMTDRFAVEDIIGRTVVIHGSPDDFTTQPSGNAGNKIACGVIRRTRP